MGIKTAKEFADRILTLVTEVEGSAAPIVTVGVIDAAANILVVCGNGSPNTLESAIHTLSVYFTHYAEILRQKGGTPQMMADAERRRKLN